MRIFLILLLISSFVWANNSTNNIATFSGRVSRLNNEAGLLRLRIDFENAKYLKQKDRVEFWNETYPDKKCIGYLEGRTPRYLLLKVPKYNTCVTRVHLTVGTYLHLYSDDLLKSLEMGQDLVSILLKKRLALNARVTRFKKEVDGYIEKMDALNSRYETLRQKLEQEWKEELSALEQDKVNTFSDFKKAQNRLNEVDFKLQQYKIEDDNMKVDRWSLDPKLYYKK